MRSEAQFGAAMSHLSDASLHTSATSRMVAALWRRCSQQADRLRGLTVRPRPDAERIEFGFVAGDPRRRHSLAVYCLGSFEIYEDNRRIPETGGRNAQAILRYLAVHRHRSVSAGQLIELCWPGCDATAGRRNLHQAVYSLRRMFREANDDSDVIGRSDEGYRLGHDHEVWVDAEQFGADVTEGDRRWSAGDHRAAGAAYGRAISLYRGAFMAETPCDEWTISLRRALHVEFVRAAERVADLYAHEERPEAVVGVTCRVLEHDPCNEDAFRRLMCALAAQGHQHLVTRVYRECVAALRAGLDVDPRPETTNLFRRLTQNSDVRTISRHDCAGPHVA